MQSLVFAALAMLCGMCLAMPFDLRDPSREPIMEKPDETFKRSDADKSGSLTFDEFLHTDLPYEQLKRDEFDQLDANHDGIITRAEYETHYRKEKQNADDLRAEYFGGLFEEFDRDFNLKLDRNEVEELLAKRFSLKPRANFPQIFAQFDKNNDGGLDLEEYLKFDSELPFSELDTITGGVGEAKSAEVQPQQQLNKPLDDDNEPSAANFNTPILAFKQEKLPMLKRRYLEKY